MTSFSKFGIVSVLVILFASVALIQQHLALQSEEFGPEQDPAPALPGVPADLPRLVNLTTETCIHCKRMVPVLAELKDNFASTFSVYSFDIARNQKASRSFGTIRTLPTLIFMDQAGHELYRFEGYMSKAEILDRWERLGLTL